MPVKKEGFLRKFFKDKKHDLIMFVIVTVLIQGVIGTWLYNKYVALDNAREKVENIHKTYLQIKTLRMVLTILIDNDIKNLKIMREKKLIFEKEFFERYDIIDKLEKELHKILSEQRSN